MATSTLREKVRAALRSKEDRILIEQGFTYESGALTKDGQKVVLDLLFADPALRSEVVELAQKVSEASKKS